MVTNGDRWIRKVPGETIPPRDQEMTTESIPKIIAEEEDGQDDGEASSEENEQSDGEQEGGVGADLADEHTETKSLSSEVENLDVVEEDLASITITPSNEEQERTDANPVEGEDDGGEWITPVNVHSRKSKDLGLVAGSGNGAAQSTLAAACMTGDYAVQNVLLGMGLGLVGEGGKRISKVKSWVLRCHACFK
jgi:RNA-binding protein NOB1